MKTEVFGQYQEESTGKISPVLKRTHAITHRPLSGSPKVLEDTFDFITDSNIDLSPLDDEFNAFELVQIDGFIKRIHTKSESD